MRNERRERENTRGKGAEKKKQKTGMFNNPALS